MKMKIDIDLKENGFVLVTPYSTTYCDDVHQLMDDLLVLLYYFMEVKKNEKQKKR